VQTPPPSSPLCLLNPRPPPPSPLG
jgi:hypothetical protein